MERATAASPTGGYVFRAPAVSIYVAGWICVAGRRQNAIGRGVQGTKIMSRSLRAVALAVAGICLCALPASAETQISVYGGANWNFKSDVSLSNSALGNEDRSIGWDGGSFGMPPYWGVRGTYWLSKNSPWGFALEYTHQKAIADLNFSTDPTYSHLEFTDGNNLVLLEALYRYATKPWRACKPFRRASHMSLKPRVRQESFLNFRDRKTTTNFFAKAVRISV